MLCLEIYQIYLNFTQTKEDMAVLRLEINMTFKRKIVQFFHIDLRNMNLNTDMNIFDKSHALFYCPFNRTMHSALWVKATNGV